MIKAFQNFGLIALCSLMIALPSPAKAEATPYASCKAEMAKNGGAECATCSLAPGLQELANPFQVLNMAPVEATAFLTIVASQVNASYDRALKSVEAKIACFSGGGGTCAKDIEGVRNTLQSDAKELHKELGIARALEGQYEHDYVGAKKGKAIDYKLDALGWRTPNPLKSLSALDAQKKAASDEYVGAKMRAVKKHQEELAKNNMKIVDQGAFVQSEMKGVIDQHKQTALNMINFGNPLLAYLPAATLSGGKYVWANSDIVTALKAQKETIVKQMKKVEGAIRDQSMEMPRITGAALLNATAMKWLGKEKLSLIDFAVMTPAVESVLKQNPQHCGLATALAARYSIREGQNGAAVMLGSMVGFGALGVGASVVGASALTADVTMGMAGLAFGSGFTYDAYHKATETAAIARATGKDSLVVTPEMVSAADAEFKAALAFSPLNFLGTGGLGKATYGFAKSGVKTAAALASTEGRMGFAQVAENVAKSLKEKTAKAAEKIATTPKSLIAAYKEQLEALHVPKAKQAAVAACLALTFGATEGHSFTAAEQKKCNEADVVLAGIVVAKDAKPASTVAKGAEVDATKVAGTTATKEAAPVMELKATGSGGGAKAADVNVKPATAEKSAGATAQAAAQEAEADAAAINYDSVLKSFSTGEKDLAAKRARLMKDFKLDDQKNRLTYDQLKMKLAEEDAAFRALKAEEQDNIVLHAYDNMSKKGLKPSEEAEKILTACGYGAKGGK